MDRQQAEAIGLAALGFLVEEPQRLGRFLTLSGMDPGDLSARAGEPHMQAALLDHILEDETLLLVFTADKRIDPEHVAPARELLAGETRMDV
jgi:DMSO/TMAO reductase YedYZ molybdopterin-dependent catalytic subunit